MMDCFIEQNINKAVYLTNEQSDSKGLVSGLFAPKWHRSRAPWGALRRISKSTGRFPACGLQYLKKFLRPTKLE
jgi:hypothetical protein